MVNKKEIQKKAAPEKVVAKVRKEIRNVRVSQLVVNKANPRTITDDKFSKLINSLLSADWMITIRNIVCDDTMLVLGGNMRTKGLLAIAGMEENDIRQRIMNMRLFKKLGHTQEEAQVLVDKWIAWKNNPTVEITQVFGLTDDQKKEFIIKDNANFGQWDFDALANEWDSQDVVDWGVDVWEEAAEEEEGKGKDVQEDEAPEVKEGEAVCKLGDIWQLGNHRLICGDSSNLEQMKKLMNGELGDMVFTDPPYGVSIGSKNQMLNKFQVSGRCLQNIANDTLKPDELYNILVKAFTNIRTLCKESASYYITAPQGGDLGMMMLKMMKDAGLEIRHTLMWLKNCATFSMGRLDYDYKHEPIMYTWVKKHNFYGGGEFKTSVWEVDKPRKCDLHPTMKPIKLIANAVENSSKEGDIVLDFFGGSGSTLIACEQLNRKCYMSELDPHYCDVIIQRWENLTGQKAVKITDKK